MIHATPNSFRCFFLILESLNSAAVTEEFNFSQDDGTLLLFIIQFSHVVSEQGMKRFQRIIIQKAFCEGKNYFSDEIFLDTWNNKQIKNREVWFQAFFEEQGHVSNGSNALDALSKSNMAREQGESYQAHRNRWMDFKKREKNFRQELESSPHKWEAYNQRLDASREI